MSSKSPTQNQKLIHLQLAARMTSNFDLRAFQAHLMTCDALQKLLHNHLCTGIIVVIKLEIQK